MIHRPGRTLSLLQIQRDEMICSGFRKYGGKRIYAFNQKQEVGRSVGNVTIQK
jgi:hypothetical protein